MERITATDAARRFSELLNRVRYRGESFAIVRNGEEVGRLVPAVRTGTLRELVELIRERGPDEGFYRDLEEIRSEQPSMPEDPWAS